MTRRTIELSAGTVDYEDSGGDGPVVLMLHGLLMDASLWDHVVADLRADHRCVAPTLPLGAHHRAMRADADLSVPGVARLVVELMDRLDLEDVTLVGSDTGGALVQLVAAHDAARVGSIALVSCDAFDNFPPAMVKPLILAGRLAPPLFGLFMQQLRLKPLRRLPIAFGWLTKRGDAATARWIEPVLRQPEIRRDTVKVLRALATDRELLVRAAARLAEFDKPALVAWAREDRVMPLEHAHRLGEVLPRSTVIDVGDSYTLVPLDQPAWLAASVRELCREASHADAH